MDIQLMEKARYKKLARAVVLRRTIDYLDFKLTGKILGSDTPEADNRQNIAYLNSDEFKLWCEDAQIPFESIVKVTKYPEEKKREVLEKLKATYESVIEVCKFK